MTWDDILVLDDTALNLAIETHCGVHQQGLFPGPLNYTLSWEWCMILAWQYNLAIHAPYAGLPGSVCVVPYPTTTALAVSTEAEARHAICQLTVARALGLEGPLPPF